MPWGRVLTFSDPFPYQSAMQGADVEVYPTARGKFHSELTQVGLNKVWMQRFHEKLPRVFASAIKPDRKVIGFLTSENQAAMRLSSMDVSPLVVIVRGRDEVHQRTEADSRFATMSLPTAELDAAYRALIGRELISPYSTYLMRLEHKVMSRPQELHTTAGLIAKITPSLFELPEVVRNLEQQLIHVLVGCLAAGAPLQISAGTRRHAAIVGRFEEFLEANPDQPLYLTEICAAIGAAERTLRAATSSRSAARERDFGALPYVYGRRLISSSNFIFSIGTTRNDQHPVIRQRQLQRHGLVPGRASTRRVPRVSNTGIALGWIGSTTAFGAAVKKP
jgi:hypothetical protein